jgi:uroporphyrinogen-III synthase
MEKSPFYEIATRHGIEVDFVPFIRLEGVTLKEFRSQRVEVLAHTAIIFTNKATIDHFFRISEQARLVIPETMKYLCQSEAIALYLQKYIVYRKRKIFFADSSFASLMELILKNRDEKLLLTLSEPYKPELSTAMTELGVPFDKVVLSRATSNDLSTVDLSRYDMLVFYSPSEIAALTARFDVADLPYIATFGNGTARAAVDAGVCVNVLAPTERVPSMTKAIDIFISQLVSGEPVAPVQLCEKREVEDFLRAQKLKPVKKSRPLAPSTVATSSSSAKAASSSTAKTAAAVKVATTTAAKASPSAKAASSAPSAKTAAAKPKPGKS